MNRRRKLVGLFWHGSKANARLQALGARAAFPGSPSRVAVWEWPLHHADADLLSAKQLGLPIKVVVFNNGSLGFIELEQEASGFIDTDTTLDNPDFAAMATAVGIHGVRFDDPANVETRMAEALAHPGPVLIDAVVNRMELAMPLRVTAGMARASGSTYSRR